MLDKFDRNSCERMTDLKFIKPPESSHWYTRDGKARYDVDLRVARKETLFSSVSTITAMLPNFALELYKQNQILHSSLTLPRMLGEDETAFAKRVVEDSKQHSKNAAEWGTGLHAAIEQFERGEPIEDKYRDYMPHYVEFRDQEIEHVIDPELILVDDTIPCAGRCDLIYGNLYQDICILDYKTTAIKPGERLEWRISWLMQLAAYREMYANMRKLAVKPRARSVVINSIQPEKFQVKEWSNEELCYAFEAFKKLAWVWYWQRQYFPLGKPAL